jgi:hypothetical protein
VRTFAKSVLTLALASGLAVAATSPADAGPLGTCPGGEPVCVYVPAGSYPIGNPVTLSPVGKPITYVELPKVCDASGSECVRTFVEVPGAYASSTPGSIATLNFPGAGIGLNGTQATLYASAPTVTPTGSTLGITVSVSADTFVVASNQLTRSCEIPRTTSLGPVSVTTNGCVTTLVLSV